MDAELEPSGFVALVLEELAEVDGSAVGVLEALAVGLELAEGVAADEEGEEGDEAEVAGELGEGGLGDDGAAEEGGGDAGSFGGLEDDGRDIEGVDDN